MMKKIFPQILFFLIVSFSISAQQQSATISFKEEAFDFGKLDESKGPVNHVFEFVNTGGAPLVLQNVQSSCGCTTPEYSNKPIMPGGKGMVKAVFNPSGRPGSFTKEITVYSTATNNPVVLRITGTVLPKTPTAEDKFRFPMGDLRFASSHMGFKLSPGKIKTDTIEFFNSGKNNVTVQPDNPPSFMDVLIYPTTLKPNQHGLLIVSYDASKKNDWGFVIDYLKLKVNNSNDPNNKITVTADITDDFSKLTPEQLANAANISFENTNYNFGTVKEGTNVECEFKFKNTGKNNLLVRKIVTSCHCTSANPAKMVIKPGEESSIKAVFDSGGTKGSQTKAVTVITNDPDNPNVVLWIKGIVN